MVVHDEIPDLPGRFADTVQVIRSRQGVVAWLFEDRSLEAVDVSFAFGAGAALDPPGRSGAARMVGAMMTFGAGPFDAATFQGKLAGAGIRFAHSVDHDHLRGRVHCPVSATGEAFRLLGLRLREPRFDPLDIDRARQGLRTRMESAQTRADIQADLAFRERAFRGHCYGRDRDGTLLEIDRIEPDDVADLHKRIVAHHGRVVTVVGAIDAATLEAALDEAFADLAGGRPVAVGPIAFQGLGEEVVVPMDVDRASIVFGRPAIAVDDPDWPIASLVSRGLGGQSPSGHLRRVLGGGGDPAIDIRCRLETSSGASTLIGTATVARSEADEAVRSIRNGMRRLADDGSEGCAAALADFKSAVSHRADGTAGALVEHLTWAQSRGMDPGWLDDCRRKRDEASASDLRRVTERLVGDGSVLVTVATPCEAWG